MCCRHAKLMTVVALLGVLATAEFSAFEVRPDKNLTGGSVRTGDRDAVCGHAGEHRGPMNATRRDEVLTRYGLPTGTHPDYEIDHLIPLCLGGSDALPICGRSRAELSKILRTGPRRYVMKLIRSRLYWSIMRLGRDSRRCLPRIQAPSGMRSRSLSSVIG
jgi:hypothetical protein